MSCPSTLPKATPFDDSFYVGLNLECILYGIELLLYYRTMRIYLARRRQRHNFDVFYAVYSTVMVIMATIWLSKDMMHSQSKWLLRRNNPGGKPAHATSHGAEAHMDLGSVAIFILQQMTDGLMLHRCRIVSGSLRPIIVPCILWLATLGLGVVVTWAVSRAGTGFFTTFTADFGLAYFSLSILLNVTLTCMICYRLLVHAKTAREYLGDRYASPYFTIIMLLVESILPFTLTGIAFMVSYGMKSPMDIGFSRVYALMMCVSPQMLILRAARGKAWQKESVKPPLSVMMFSSTATGAKVEEVSQSHVDIDV